MYKPTENDVALWTVAVGKIRAFPFMRKGTKEALMLIKEQEGFVGIHPVNGQGTLLLFDSENNAKGARNILRHHGIQCGREICKVYVDKKYLRGTNGE